MSTVCSVHMGEWIGVGACSAEGQAARPDPPAGGSGSIGGVFIPRRVSQQNGQLCRFIELLGLHNKNSNNRPRAARRRIRPGRLSPPPSMHPHTCPPSHVHATHGRHQLIQIGIFWGKMQFSAQRVHTGSSGSLRRGVIPVQALSCRYLLQPLMTMIVQIVLVRIA